MADARELIQATHDTWMKRDLEAYRELAGPGVEIRIPGGSTGTGPEGLEQLYRGWNEAFPDNEVEVLTIICEGDAAALEGHFTGTHTGTMQTPVGEVAPTGRRVELDYSLVVGEAGGRLSSYRLYYDQVGLLTQLGLMPG